LELAAVAIQAPTLFHRAPTDVGTGAHVELGEPAIVAERTGTLVVSDLRPADVAAGGHGAPLSVYVDYLLFRDAAISRAVQNIGGIANVTYLRAGARPEDLLSFDTGPGNLLIDEAMRRLTGGNEQFDPSGSWAARGKVCQPLLAELMRHPYLERRPPKTTGREDFGSRLVDEAVGRATELGCSPEDLVATLTAFTVECIRLHFVRDLAPRGPLDEVILSGGGTHNDELMRRLREALQPARLRLHDEFGIPGDAREAVTWAVLADESLFGRPANIPDASGARHPVILGRVSFGRPPRLD
jgi:anhydro-N-acetylmuramic acid kinase